MPQGVRIAGKLSVRLSEVSFELDVDEDFEVRPRDDAFPLAAVEKVPQENGSLERFGNSPNDIVGRHEGSVAFGIAGNARFAFGPFEHRAREPMTYGRNRESRRREAAGRRN